MKRIGCLFLILSVFCGCKPGDESVAQKQPVDASVLAMVAGKPVTTDSVNALLDFKFNLILAKRAIKFPMAKSNREKLRKAFSRQYVKGAKSEAILAAIVESAAEKMAIVTSEADRARVCAQYAVNIGGSADSFAMVTSVVDRIGFLSEFNAQIEREMRSLACFRKINPGVDFDVSEVEINDFIEKSARENAARAASNTVAYVTASNVLSQIRAGADFAKLADEYSQDPEKEEGGDMGFLYLSGPSSYTGYAPAYICAAMMEDGAVSNILKTPDGLEIIKVLEHNVIEKPDDPIARHIARICFALHDVYPDMTREQSKALLTKKRMLKIYGVESYEQLISIVPVEVRGFESPSEFLHKIFSPQKD